jgi:hypothetical protein
MGWTRKAHEGGEEKCIQNLNSKTYSDDHLGDVGEDGRNILKWVLK